MQIKQLMDLMDDAGRARFLARLEGLELAQRILRNQLADVDQSVRDYFDECLGDERPMAGTPLLIFEARRQGLLNALSAVRLVQVNIGNGTQPFPERTDQEQENIDRIY